MRLAQLRKQWSYLSSGEKIDLVSKSNDRRLETFEIVKNKRSNSGKKSTKRSKSKTRSSRKKTPTTAQGLLDLTKGMTEEERKNLEMYLLTQQQKK